MVEQCSPIGSVQNLVRSPRLFNQPLRHLLQSRILYGLHLLHISPHTECMIVGEPPPTHRLLVRTTGYVMSQIGVILVVCVCLIFHEARVEPEREPVRVGLEWLGGADLWYAFGVCGDGPNDARIARVKGVGDIG